MTEKQALRLAEQLQKEMFDGVESLRFIYEPEPVLGQEGLTHGLYDDPGGIGVFFTRKGREDCFEWMSS